MDLETRNLQIVIDREVKAFEAEAERLIKNNAKRFSYTGNLEDTIDLAVQRAKDDFTYNITAYFGDKGKIIEKKETFAYRAPIKVLEDWVKHIGVQNFRFVPNSEKRGELTRDQKANRIAWGIKISENRYRFQQMGGSISARSIGGGRANRSNQISWFYRPYFGLWAKYRQRIFDAYFQNLSPALAEMVEEQLNESSVSVR